MTLTQKQLDKEMVESGKSRYWRRTEKAKKGERECDTDHGTRLLSAAVYPVAEALREEYKTIGRPGFNNTGVKALLDSGIEPEVLALLALQSVIDGISRKQRASRVMSIIGRRIQTEVLLERLAGDKPFLLKTVARWTSDPQSDLRRRATIKKIVSNMNEECTELVRQATIDDALLLRMGFVLVELIRRHTGLIEIKNVTTSAKSMTTWIVPTQETVDWIRNYGSKSEFLRPVKLPMVVPPYNWSSPTVGGYANDLGEDLIRSDSGMQMSCATKQQMPVVYKVINSLQRVPLRVNQQTLQVVDTLYRNGVVFGDLPPVDDVPAPPRPNIPATDPAIKIWRRDVHRIQEANRTNMGRRINVAQTLALAERFRDTNFFLPVCMDFRGRVYPQTTYLSYQAGDIGKGLTSFGLGKAVKPGTPEWTALLLGGSGHLGTKGSIRQRIDSADKFVSSGGVKAVAADPFGNKSLWIDADEPVQFLSWCFDVAGVLAGRPSHHPVWMDASCNGLQIISLLLRDSVGGTLTNCVPSSLDTSPVDIYTAVAARTVELLCQETDQGKVEWAREWVRYGIDRAAVKRCVMIVPYNGSIHAGVTYIRDWYQDKYRMVGGPWKEPAHPIGYLARIVWKAIGETVCKGMEFMKWMRDVQKVCNAHQIQPSWVTPSGFVVHQTYHQYDACNVKTTLGRTVRMFQLRKASKRVATRKHLNALAPNYIHSLDAAAEVLTFNRLLEMGIDNVLGQHDSYGSLAADAPKVYHAVRATWSSMFSEDLLATFAKHIRHELPKGVELPVLPAYGDLDPLSLRNSPYFFS
jgi:DNA-directed RNA polymerase